MTAAGQGDEGRLAPKSLLAWSLRVTVVIGLVAVAGAAQLARWNRPGDGPGRMPDRMAGGVIPALVDPETTGAIAGAAQAARGTRLDPCLVPVAAPAVGHLRP